MSPTYEFFAQLAQTWGLVYFFVLFIAVLALRAVAVAARSSSTRRARMPLRED